MAEKQWYDIVELAAYLELDERLIRTYISDGLIPRPVPLSKKKSAYHRTDLEILVWIIRHKDRFSREKLPPEDEI